MADEKVSLEYDLTSIPKDVAPAKKAMEDLSAATDKAAESTKKAEKGTADFGRTALEGSRILQDFAQGGLGGIINNLEGFARAVGLGAGAAGAMTGLGVAVLALGPPLKNLVKTLVDGANDIPKSTDALDALNREFKTASTRLDDLKGKQSLTNAELAEYNSLMTSTVRLEKEANAERARRSALEAARNQENQNPDAAKAAQAAIKGGGGIDKLIDQLAPDFVQAARPEAEAPVRALREQLAKALAANKNSIKDQEAVESVYRPQIEAAMKAAAAEAQRMGRGRAADLLLAAGKGEAGPINELADRLPGLGFSGATPEGLASARATEAARKQAEEDAKQQAKRRDDAVKALDKEREKDAKAKADQFVGPPVLDAGALAERQDQAREREKADEEQRRIEARVGQPAPGRGAAQDLVREMKRDQEREIAAFLNQQTGGQVDAGTLSQAAEGMAQQIRRGVDPMKAAVDAMQRMAQAQAWSNQQMAMLSARVQQIDAYIQQNQQISRTRMGLVRP